MVVVVSIQEERERVESGIISSRVSNNTQTKEYKKKRYSISSVFVFIIFFLLLFVLFCFVCGAFGLKKGEKGGYRYISFSKFR